MGFEEGKLVGTENGNGICANYKGGYCASESKPVKLSAVKCVTGAEINLAKCGGITTKI